MWWLHAAIEHITPMVHKTELVRSGFICALNVREFMRMLQWLHLIPVSIQQSHAFSLHWLHYSLVIVLIFTSNKVSVRLCIASVSYTHLLYNCVRWRFADHFIQLGRALFKSRTSTGEVIWKQCDIEVRKIKTNSRRSPIPWIQSIPTRHNTINRQNRCYSTFSNPKE